jgi:hypothetical protein
MLCEFLRNYGPFGLECKFSLSPGVGCHAYVSQACENGKITFWIESHCYGLLHRWEAIPSLHPKRDTCKNSAELK